MLGLQVDFVRDETLIELRLRFGKLCGVADGITIPIEKEGSGPVFKGLKKWICGVDDLLCRQVRIFALQTFEYLIIFVDM